MNEPFAFSLYIRMGALLMLALRVSVKVSSFDLSSSAVEELQQNICTQREGEVRVIYARKDERWNMRTYV